MRFNARKLGALSAAAVAVGALGALPSAAPAAFDTSHDTACETVANITGLGASFAKQAQIGWGANIGPTDPFTQTRSVGFGASAFGAGECRAFDITTVGARTVTYDPSGSGAARAAFGATAAANRRHTNAAGGAITPVNFGGVDEAPTTTQLTNANAGDTTTSTDNATLHTIPIAQSAVAVDVRLPAGCSLAADPELRQLSAEAVEGAFAGDADFDTWGELFDPAEVSCPNTRIVRVVRFDSSGTTFVFKRFLATVAGGLGSGWLSADDGGSLANQDWPSRTTVVTSNRINGAGALLDTLSGVTTGLQNGSSVSVTGGIGYADVATSRGTGAGREFGWGSSTNDSNDERFWVYVERPANLGTYAAPASRSQQQSGTKGSACSTTRYSSVPANTTSTWFPVQSSATTTDYPICALTYALTWQDPTPVNVGINAGSGGSPLTPLTQSQTRANVDRLQYQITCGQNTLAGSDYAALPATIDALSTTGIATLTWNGGTPALRSC